MRLYAWQSVFNGYATVHNMLIFFMMMICDADHLNFLMTNKINARKHQILTAVSSRVIVHIFNTFSATELLNAIPIITFQVKEVMHPPQQHCSLKHASCKYAPPMHNMTGLKICKFSYRKRFMRDSKRRRMVSNFELIHGTWQSDSIRLNISPTTLPPRPWIG